jgi:hypothetical protein
MLSPSKLKETSMDFSLTLTLYLSLGLALTQLRRNQGMAVADALFCGVFWPLDLLRRGIELLVRSLLQVEHCTATLDAPLARGRERGWGVREGHGAKMHKRRDLNIRHARQADAA